MNVLFLLVGENSINHVSETKLSTHRTVLYMIRLLRKHGHNATYYMKSLDKVDYDYLDKCKPDIICLESGPDENLITWAKSTGAIIGMGTGTFPGKEVAMKFLEAYDWLNFVVIGGEPYNTWIEVTRSIEAEEGFKNIKGVAYRDGSEIKINDGRYDFDINDFDDTDILLSHGLSSAIICTSLGCIGNCTFCSEKLEHKKWQGRKIEKVIEEIKNYTDKGCLFFQFADTEIEAPDIRLERLTKLCKGMISLNQPISYQAMFRPDFARKTTPEIMDLLIESGLYEAFIGAESGCQKDLDLFNKRCSVQDVKDTINLFESYGIHTKIGFIMFHPFSTIESLEQNVELLEDLGKADFNTISNIYYANGNDRLTIKTDEEGLYCKDNNKWSFKDSKISSLFFYIYYFFNTMKDTLVRYDGVVSSYGWYRSIYGLYENNIEKRNALLAYYKRVSSTMQFISTILCIWFRKLIEVTKEGFTDEKAVSVSLSFLNKDLLNDVTDYLERETKKLNKIISVKESE